MNGPRAYQTPGKTPRVCNVPFWVAQTDQKLPDGSFCVALKCCGKKGQPVIGAFTMAFERQFLSPMVSRGLPWPPLTSSVVPCHAQKISKQLQNVKTSKKGHLRVDPKHRFEWAELAEVPMYLGSAG